MPDGHKCKPRTIARYEARLRGEQVKMEREPTRQFGDRLEEAARMMNYDFIFEEER